jgi:hypothetical protein
MNYDQPIYHDPELLLDQLLYLREDVVKNGVVRFERWKPSLERDDFYYRQFLKKT